MKLIAFGAALVLWLRGADTRPGSVVTADHMLAPRFDHAAALLPNGRVLIVGGIARNGVIEPSAEVFDPATKRFSATGKPQGQHGWGVVAVSLSDGRLLVAGGSTGCDEACYTDTAELYDPVAGTFTLTGRLKSPRAEARALRLANGDVLIVGGGSTTAEVYHPESGAFTETGRTNVAEATQVVLLKDGRVLVMGPSGSDLYDPSKGQFMPTGKMKTPRGKFGAALLPDGRVLIVGGQTGGARGPRLNSTELYDPAMGSFSAGPELTVPRFKLSKAVVALRDGRVLIAGGAPHPEIYDPTSGALVVAGGASLDAFHFSTATLLSDGRVLLAGGYANPPAPGVDHAWIFEP